jgi:hypothetical protein
MAWRLSWIQQGEAHLKDYESEADARSAALILRMHLPKVCRCIVVNEVDAVALGPLPEADLEGQSRAIILKFPRRRA